MPQKIDFKQRNKDKTALLAQVKSLFGIKYDRVNCPGCFNPAAPTAGASPYLLSSNHCFRCNYPNDASRTYHEKASVTDLIALLSKKNPKLFPSPLTSAEAHKLLSENNIPTFFYKVETYSESQARKKTENNNLQAFFESLPETKTLAEGEVIRIGLTDSIRSKAEGNDLRLFDDIPNDTHIYIQTHNHRPSITVGERYYGNPMYKLCANPLVPPPSFVNTSAPDYKPPQPPPTFIDMARTTEEFYEKISKKPTAENTSFFQYVSNYLSLELKDQIKNQPNATINIPNEAIFELIVEHCAEMKVRLPTTIINSEPPKTIPSTGITFIKPTTKTLGDGVNYINIKDPQPSDNLLQVGRTVFEMTPEISLETKQLLRTGALSLSSVLSKVAEPKPENPFVFNSSVAITKAIKSLSAVEPTENITAEIEILKNLSDTQRASMDVQLQICAAIKLHLKGQFFGVKGSANNLNCLYLMGITSVSPANDPLLKPSFFLDPSTDKNPDIDFELSSAQVKSLSKKFPTLTKGLMITKVGNRIHPTKYYLTDIAEYSKFSGGYIPIDSKLIEESAATPIDFITSRIMGKLNKYKLSDAQDIPAADKVIKYSEVFSSDLPHFNSNVERLSKESGVYQPESILDAESMASLCSINRPVFYLSLVHATSVDENDKKDYWFSHTGSRDSEALYGLNEHSKNIARSFNQAQLSGYKLKPNAIINSSISGKFKVEEVKKNYLVSLLNQPKNYDEPILSTTNGVIVYQDQLFILLKKYTKMTGQEISGVIKRISHPTKIATEVIDGVETPITQPKILMDPSIPPLIHRQITFITESQNAFFFKKSHALFLGHTALTLFALERKKKDQLLRRVRSPAPVRQVSTLKSLSRIH